MRKITSIEDRLKTSVPEVTWDISKASKEQRSEIKNRLFASILFDEKEYRTVLSYMHKKYPDLMDVYPNDGRLFQWCYQPYNEKIEVFDTVSRTNIDMYGLVYYDPERDMEPVAIGGSYFRRSGVIRDPWTNEILPGQPVNKHTSTIRIGRGYRLFVDPDYRRMGLAQDQWITEAQIYRDCNVRYQKEIQTFEAFKVTQSIFDDPSKCFVLNRRKSFFKSDYVKCVMDYEDKSLIRRFDEMPENLKNFRNKPKWWFLKRESLSIEELVSPWVVKFSKDKANRDFEENLSTLIEIISNSYKYNLSKKQVRDLERILDSAH